MNRLDEIKALAKEILLEMDVAKNRVGHRIHKKKLRPIIDEIVMIVDELQRQ